MSDTILGGKLTVYYGADNRRKQIKWSGTTAKTDTQKMIDVYDACEDLMTEADQMDDGLIFDAPTPGEYIIGKIDAGELDPWFIDLKTMEHIVGDYLNFTGCALRTSGWTRDLPGDGTGNVGIVVIPVTNIDIAASDIGDTITHTTDNDSGTLLDFVDTGGATDYLFIRPADNTLANDFNTGSGTLECSTSTNQATQTAVAHTGEMVWGNVFTTGALVNNDTHIYVFQNGVKVTISDDTDNDWWPDGHLDRAFPIKDYKTSAFPTIDEGYLTVKANQYASKYTYSIIRMNTTSGGNVAAGLSSGDDIYNDTGYASVDLTGASGNWNVGDEIKGATSEARAIITQIENPGATPTLHFFYIGDPLTAFSTSEVINNQDDTGTGSEDGGGVNNEGPADTAWFDGSAFPTYAFANTQVDIDDDATAEEYGITIDLNQASLAQMHEYNKYVMRRGSTTSLDGLDGEEWIGLDYAVNYSTITGTVSEGATVTGATSGATGVVVSNPAGTNNTALLRNSRGSFQDAEDIQVDGGNKFNASGLTVEVITPVAEASFGTMAGVNFFGSRGVVLTDYKTTEENLFSLIDATGVTRARPTTISMSIGNLKQYDYVACYRLTGALGDINKTEYTCTGGESIGDATLDLDSAIAADVPGKTLGGTCILVDVTDDNREYVLRYSSYAAATGTITLANSTWTAEALTDDNTIIDTGAFANTKVGDLVYNNDLTAVSYVVDVVDDDEITIYPPLTGQDQNDTGEINCVPVVPTSSDKVFFAIVFEFRESDGTASASMQYLADIYSRVRVRNTSDAATKIKGYTSDVTIGTGGGTATATRIENTVYGS